MAAAEDSLRRLVDDLIALGPEPAEDDVRAAVAASVRRFNSLNDEGWICTLEREDIYEQIAKAIDLCGFECDEDRLGERDW